MEENRVLREQLKGQRLRVNDLCLLKTRPPRLSCGLCARTANWHSKTLRFGSNSPCGRRASRGRD
jgi:hypothetical protein